MSKIQTRIIIALFAFIIALASMVFVKQPAQPLPAELIAVVRPKAVTLKEFSLTNQHNQSFTLEQLRNRQSLIFFGYTSCPDICPTTLSTLNILFKLLEKKQASENLQVVFITVDPERDNIEKLNAYMNYFNEDFIAATGNKDEIDKVAKQFNAAYFIENDNASENYLISHASSIFLVNQETKIIASFSPPHNPDILAEQYLKIREFFNFK